ncbi:MAG: hypothetical protein IKD77_03895 [Bacilli bacterium]|nr:hypothetical protein [Bacilli bacterium]
MNKNGYTLVHEDKPTSLKTIIVELTPYLTNIDAFTTNFDNEFELWEAVEMMGYSVFSDNFYVEYRSGRRRTKLPVVYSDNERLKELSHDNQGSTKVKANLDQSKFITSLAKKAEEDYELLRYLYENHFITQKVHDDIARYNLYRTRDVEESAKTLSALRGYFIYYSHIRKVEIGIRKYYEKDKTVEEPQEKPKVLTKLPQPTNVQMQLFDPNSL